MSASQDNLLNQEVIEAQGEDLLDQLVNSGEDSLEDGVVEYERVLGPSSPMFSCEEADLFEDDSITNSQLHCDAKASTEEGNLGGPVQSPEEEEIPHPHRWDRVAAICSSKGRLGHHQTRGPG